MVADTPALLLHAAADLARVAGDVALRHFRPGPAGGRLAVETKGDGSPVTVADRSAEEAARAWLAERYSADDVLGEEFGRSRRGTGRCWVLDPIDGTKSFITGRPLFGTLIALAHAGRPVLGVIDQAILRERWVGMAGEASFHNGRPIGVRPCPRLEDAVLLTTSPDLFEGPERLGFARLHERVRLTLYGGDCYAYGQLAMGLVDLVVETGLAAYDFMALAPVIEGAGGRLTDWRGGSLTLDSAGDVVASGDPRTAAAAQALLQPHAATA